jgi:hypothetical protein
MAKRGSSVKRAKHKVEPIFTPTSIDGLAPADIDKARSALQAFIIAHAEYDDVWATAWPVLKSPRHFRHIDQQCPARDQITISIGKASQNVADAFSKLHILLEGMVGSVHEECGRNVYRIGDEPIKALGARYIEACAALTWHVGENEVPAPELREELILRASIGLALLKVKS